MSRTVDVLVIGADVDGLAAATSLASAGKKVLLVDGAAETGGALREIEFAPGYRAAPLASAHDTPIIACGDGAPLLIHSSPERTAQSLKARSAKDAANWPSFAARMRASAGFLAELYRSPSPRVEADTFSEYFGLAGLALKYRKLGRDGMIDLLRTLPMPIADLLDDEFETSVLKGALAALAVSDVAQGPAAAGTAFTYLHRLAASVPGVNDESLAVGSHALIDSMTSRARSAGVQIETSTQVNELLVRDGRVTGAMLASTAAGSGVKAEEIACTTAVSSLDPYTSLLELVDPKHHDPELIHAVRNIRFRGVSTRILVALDALPDVGSLVSSTDLSGASLMIAPSVRYIERAYEGIKYGRCSDEPFVEVRFPSARRPALAPAGGHVAVINVQYTPYQLREGNWNAIRDSLADRVFAMINQHLPGFTARATARKVLSPQDLESLLGVREGAVSQGEMMLDQILFMRPVPAASRYSTPIKGYFLCGAGSHPGPGIHGVSGRLAARAALS